MARTKSSSKVLPANGGGTPSQKDAVVTASSAPAARGSTPSLTVHPGPFTLALDIGGTGTKVIVLDAVGAPVTDRARLDTPRPATPAALLAVIAELLKPLPAYDRVSVGFPGVVQENIVRTAPNLDEGWQDFPLGAEIEKLAGRPTRVLNDAGVQGFGVIEGHGVEMVLTFGTGMGTALYVDGRYVPNLELAHHPLRKGRTYEETVDNAALQRVGKRRWREKVKLVVETVLPIWNPRMLYLGGGNARHLKLEHFPAKVRITENIAGLLGGIALWKETLFWVRSLREAVAARGIRAGRREASMHGGRSIAAPPSPPGQNSPFARNSRWR